MARQPLSHPTIAIVLAGGSGLRFGGDTNKVLVTIGGRPVLAYSLSTFERSPRIDAIVIVARAGDEAAIGTIVERARITKVAAVVPGGDTRQGSEWQGLQAAARLGFIAPTVLLHDAARPFLTTDVLDRVLDDDHSVGTIPTVPVRESLVDSEGRLVPNDDLMRVQTPQAFPLELLLEIYPRAEADGFAGVDTAETVQHYRAEQARWVLGDPHNIKVTHPDDRALAERLAGEFADGCWLEARSD